MSNRIAGDTVEFLEGMMRTMGLQFNGWPADVEDCTCQSPARIALTDLNCQRCGRLVPGTPTEKP
jgi:hypothetical protein